MQQSEDQTLLRSMSSVTVFCEIGGVFIGVWWPRIEAYFRGVSAESDRQPLLEPSRDVRDVGTVMAVIGENSVECTATFAVAKRTW